MIGSLFSDMISSWVSWAISSLTLEATILPILESAVDSLVKFLKNKSGFIILYRAYASTLILFLSLVRICSGGTSTLCNLLSNFVTWSMNGVLNLSPGFVWDCLNSPKVVTIATSVSSTVKKACKTTNIPITKATITGVIFLFIFFPNY